MATHDESGASAEANTQGPRTTRVMDARSPEVIAALQERAREKARAFDGTRVLPFDPKIDRFGPIEIRYASVSAMDNIAYVIVDRESGEALVVDAADFRERIFELIAEADEEARAEGRPPVRPIGIFTTHQHWDHWQALARVKQRLQVPTIAGALDADDIGVPTDLRVNGGDVLKLGAHELELIHLRGHTPGSIAIVVRVPGEAVRIITGDSLFPGGVGNTWGDRKRFAQLTTDVERRIFARFDDDTVIYPGHGLPTTLGRERPQLNEWRRAGGLPPNKPGAHVYFTPDAKPIRIRPMTPDPANPEREFLLLMHGSAPQSAWNPADPTDFLAEYGVYPHIVPFLDAGWPASTPLKVLQLGAGAFTLVRYIEHTRAGSAHTVVDIDDVSVEVALEAAPLPDGTQIEIAFSDARDYVHSFALDGRTAAFDVIVVDVFNGLEMPASVTTSEFFAEARSLLRESGMLLMNLVDAHPFDQIKSLLAGARESFGHLALVALPAVFDGSRDGNLILVASRAPLPVSEVEPRLRAADPEGTLLAGDELAGWIGSAEPLRDRE